MPTLTEEDKVCKTCLEEVGAKPASGRSVSWWRGRCKACGRLGYVCSLDHFSSPARTLRVDDTEVWLFPQATPSLARATPGEVSLERAMEAARIDATMGDAVFAVRTVEVRRRKARTIYVTVLECREARLPSVRAHLPHPPNFEEGHRWPDLNRHPVWIGGVRYMRPGEKRRGMGSG